MEARGLSACRADSLPPRERRRSAILDAAEALFIEQGYERTSLADIVRRSGGSLATLYELFGNKQGLLHAIAARWCLEVEEPIERGTDTAEPHAELLMRYAHRKCQTLNSPRNVALIRMLVSEYLRDRDFALQIYRELHLPTITELSAIFAEWTLAGEASIDDPEAAAHLFLSIISGDSVLNALAGVEDGVLNEEQIRWRLEPFISHFKIGAADKSCMAPWK